MAGKSNIKKADKPKKTAPIVGIETPEELTAINVAQEEVIIAQQKEINTLKLAQVEVAQTGRPVSAAPKEFEIDGKIYPFTAPVFRLPGFGKMTAEQALNNPDALRLLADMQTGIA